MSNPQKFRKKPVVIEAVKVDDVLYDAARNWKGLPDWIVEAYEHGDQAGAGSIVFARDGVHITTLEGTMVGDRGDWIIRGVAGELYPCKPDIFDATYDRLAANDAGRPAVADVPDAPDDRSALIAQLEADARRFDGSPLARTARDAVRLLSEDAAAIAKAEETLADLHQLGIAAVGYMEARAKQAEARLAEAERLLKDSLRAVPPREAIDAFLAGCATPPEAPQQTAERRCGVLVQVGTDGEAYICALEASHYGHHSGAVAPTEADRP